MSAFVTRFAPSPTGFLHLGHALSALTAFDAASAAGGRFLLRIEDVDQTRSRPEFEAAILEDLAWLGVEWEIPVRRQSEHFSDYRAALQKLHDQGLVYPSRRSRREAMAGEGSAGEWIDSMEAVTAESLSESPIAWRLLLAAARSALQTGWQGLGFVEERVSREGIERIFHPAEPGRLGDAILARKDSPASYHLAVVCDDALQGITHVIRGEDLREATHLHCLLQTLLGLPVPIYRFHKLIPDPVTGRKLSKRDGATGLRALRRAGASPAEIRAQIHEFSG